VQPGKRTPDFKQCRRSSRGVFFAMFLLVYNSCTGDFIETFTYMNTIYPNLVHLLHYSPWPLPLLKMTLISFNVPYLYMCRKYINHIHPPSLSSSLNITCFTFLHCLSVCSLFKEVLPWYFTCKYIVLQSIWCALFLFLNLSPYPVLFNTFHTDVIYFSVIHSLSLFSSSFTSLL
jgi:hypothetical protein